MPTPDLPPWGHMDQQLRDAIASHIIPYDWRLRDGGAPTQANWNAWCDGLLAMLSNALWPVYNPATRDWQGAARTTAIALTDADLALMAPLRDLLDTPVTARFDTTVTHRDLFLREDDDALDFGLDYLAYDPVVDRGLRLNLPALTRESLGTKSGNLALILKDRLQRPRPHQVAVLRGTAGFSHELATSATTPSMVSGHCLQGALAGCLAFARWTAPGPDQVTDAAALACLAQFTVDIGDRRVFAGVHYPSDSLGSWLVALAAIPHLFGSRAAEVLRFLAQAIVTRSEVYAAMGRHLAQNATSPYSDALGQLQALATPPAG